MSSANLDNDIEQNSKKITAERYQADEYAENYKREYATGKNFKGFRSWVIARAECNAVRKVVREIPIVGKVLDVPCGTGKLGPTLSRFPVKITAGDISESMMKYAKGEYAEEKFDGFELCDVCNLNFPDNTFDTIVCLRLFQRLSRESRIASLQEFARVTKNDLIISYSISTPWQRLKNALKWWHEKGDLIFFHVSRREILAELSSVGFEVKRYQSVLPIISSEVVIHCCLKP